MKTSKRAKLPRGLHWGKNSPYIYFSHRDGLGKLHEQSTKTSNPAQALTFKLEFLEKREQSLAEQEAATPDLSKLPLDKVKDMYFAWREAGHPKSSVARERRIFSPILKFLGKDKIVRSIKPAHIHKYQIERRKHVSKTMKRQVCTKTVNYETGLLRNVMKYAGCWTAELQAGYQRLPQRKSDIGQAATPEQLSKLLNTARQKEEWEVSLYCAASAIGSGCRGGEIRNLQLEQIKVEDGYLKIPAEKAKNGKARNPRLTEVGQWGIRKLLERARALGACEPHHYLLPLYLRKSRKAAKLTKAKWDLTCPMTGWVKSWRNLVKECGMTGFRFHDLRHTFRTLGAQAGVPLEVMMAQVGHMDAETSIDYVHIQNEALQKAQLQIQRQQSQLLTSIGLASPEPSSTPGATPLLPSASGQQSNLQEGS